MTSSRSKFHPEDRDKEEDETKEEEKQLLGRKPINGGKEGSGKSGRRKSSKVYIAGDNPKEENQEFFGVRSYLHNFYESVTVKNPQMYEDIYEEDWAYTSHSRKRRVRFFRGCWRFSIMLGIIMFLVGLTFLLFGYLMPTRGVIAGYNADMEIIDQDATKYNDFLKLCRIIGLVIFCSGGVIFCLALLLPVMINLQCDDDSYREPFQVMFAPEEPPRSPTDKKIPATEELSSIQPKREIDEEVVMTNSGLCKVPSRAADP